MGKYLAGYILGLVSAWLWFYKMPAWNFRQILGAEIDKNYSAEMVHRLEQKVKELEKYLYSLDAGRYPPKEVVGDDCPVSTRREQVIRLWEGGFEKGEIVRGTGLSKGEVELILSLQEHRFQMGNNR